MATQVTVSGTLVDATGVGLSGTITFTPTIPLYDTDGNQVVGTAPTVATLSSGAFSAVIYATDDATTSPTGATYTITESLSNASGSTTPRSYRAEIPSASSTLSYEDITEAVPSTRALTSYATSASLTAVQATAEGAVNAQGRQHTVAMQGWSAAVSAYQASQSSTVRAVVIGDSIPELLAGYSTAATKAQAFLDGSSGGTWIDPSWVLASIDGTFVQDGTQGTIGLDMKGRVLTDTDQVGSTSTQVFADRFDIYYTAATSGADLEVYVDGVLETTIDTSTDEDGAAVATDTPSQRVQVDVSPGLHTFYVIASGGTVYYENAYAAPTTGVEWYGFGKSGVTTPQIVSNGGPVAFVQAMTDRSEPPHLILLGADTAEVASDSDWTTASASVTTLVGQLQTAAPNASIVYLIPHGHGTPTPAQYAAWAEDWRNLCITLGIGYVDLYEAIGHVGNSYDPNSLSADGVHLNATGGRLASNAILDVILSRNVEPDTLESEVWLPAGVFNSSSGSPSQSGSLWYLDASSAEVVNALVKLPDHWKTYDVHFLWAHVGGSTGAGVRWNAITQTVKDGAAVIFTESNTAQATATAPATTIVKDSTIASDVTVPTGGFLNLQAKRDATHADDTLAVDAILAGVRLVKST